jgi:predicted ATPase/class 3 adenylate cyclase/DNA-binding CsgD family transcriptional regulator
MTARENAISPAMSPSELSPCAPTSNRGGKCAKGLMFPVRWDRIVASMSETDWSDLDVTELLPTGTVTLLLADVEGSTQLWESQPSAMTAAVEQLNRTASKLIAEHGGVRPVEQGEGDSFVAAFARASDAVACALDLQRSPLAPIKLRIGLHTGEVQLRDEGNYAGSTINKTARLRDLAHGGQTVLSSATEEMVEDRLPDDAWLTNLGSHALRDLARPMRISQLCHPDVRSDFPPLRAANIDVAQHLPIHLTTFVGRAAQIDEIRSLLVNNRLVTLTGAGGAGKTRLAIEIAARMTGDFPDGVWYADLAPVTHTDVVPVAVARALGLPDQPGRSIRDTLQGYVRDRHLLLVLDNCEHLLEASAALVTDMLAACSKVAVLATSREPLLVPGEVNWGVPSLSLSNEAVDLFADRARRARPDFAVNDGNAASVMEICRRLDGMPLAIELAAARVRALSLDEIVSSLHDRFRLLTGGARTAVRRQQTLRASVDWSHALLTESEQVLFRRLAVLMGGFDFDAAQAVAGATEVERFQVLDQLSLLVDKSLVIAESTSSPTRYRLLETVRQYALEKLGESGESETVRTRHRDHYTALATRLDVPAPDGHQQEIDQAQIEIDNLRAAFAWSLENGAIAEALQIATSLQPLWLARGRALEGAAWLHAAAADLDDVAIAPTLRARAMADMAMFTAWLEGIADALEQTEKALAIARDIDDPALLARALTARGAIVAHDYAAAEPYFTEAKALARDLGDSWRLCQILGRQTFGAFVAGDLIATELIAAEGVALADAVGDSFGSGQCRWGLVGVHMHRGEVVLAGETAEDMIVRATAGHDLMSTVIGLFLHAYALAFHGEPTRARKVANAAAEAASEMEGIFKRATYSAIAVACLAEGDPAAAWEAALVAEQGNMHPDVDNLNMVYMAQAAEAVGEIAVARRWADAAVATAKTSWLATALSVRALVRLAQDETEQASSDAYDGLANAAASGAHLATADTLEILADLTSDAQRHSDAVRLLGAAHAIRERLGLVRLKVYDAHHDALVTKLRKAFGESDFDTSWAEGAELSTKEAVAYALRGRGERGRPPTGWGSLTPTELDVVRLVAEGISNKDIATRLFVSPRTVQSHLRHVYNKLGLTSRVQLAQEAARH